MFDRYNYVVIPEKKKVIAYSSYAGQSIRGVAKCAPEDKFDVEFGKRLAAARCDVKVARKRLHRAMERRSMAWDEFVRAEERLLKEEDYVDDANAALAEAEVDLEFVISEREAAVKNMNENKVAPALTFNSTSYSVPVIYKASANYYDSNTKSVDKQPISKKENRWARFWKWFIEN